MYKEYRFQKKDEYKAVAKQEEIRRAYGVKVPVFEVELPSLSNPSKGERFLSLVYPMGLVPKQKKSKLTF